MIMLKLLWTALVLYVAFYFVTKDNTPDPKPQTVQVQKSLNIQSKWNDMLEMVILKYDKPDDYVECRTKEVDGSRYAMCGYTKAGYRQRPLFLIDDDHLLAVNGAAKKSMFLRYDEISKYDQNSGQLDIPHILEAFKGVGPSH